ncbi:hypothetical protein V8E36_008291 [Tilletia maclaganii]
MSSSSATRLPGVVRGRLAASRPVHVRSGCPGGVARRGIRTESTSSTTPRSPTNEGRGKVVLAAVLTASFGALGTYLALHPSAEAPRTSRIDLAIQALKQAFNDESRISIDKDDLHNRGYSAWSYHPAAPPAVVVWPTSVEECVAIVRIATQYGCAIVPFGGGTSLENHFSALPPEQAKREGLPLRPTISVDFELMSDVLDFHEDDGDIVVQPGLKWEDLNQWLSDT